MTTVKEGVTGNSVTVCQTILRSLWCTDEAGKFIEPDGQCGPKTAAAIIEFQEKAASNGLYDGKIDGQFGPKCWAIVGY